MSSVVSKKFASIVIMLLISLFMGGCHEIGEEWGISVGKDYPKTKVFYEGEEPREVRVCLDKKGYSGWPTTVVAEYDDNIYGGMLEGQCMFFTGKRVAVRFGTPSSGKYAKGTYKLVDINKK